MSNRFIGKRSYTLRPDLPVAGEKLINNLSVNDGSNIPSSLLKINDFPPQVWNQGQTNSCTAQSMAAIYYYFNKIDASRLFQYYNERMLMNVVSQDVGVSLRDAVNAFFDYGICDESLWPFDVANLTVKPPVECYNASTIGSISSAAKFNTQNPNFINQVKNALYLGMGVIIGIEVFPGIEDYVTDMTGIVPMPTPDQQPIGGHALPLVGYSDLHQLFVFRNSWGPEWGHNGYGALPYDYLKNFCISSWAFSDKEMGDF
jgi:C1A family cysteine protease